MRLGRLIGLRQSGAVVTSRRRRLRGSSRGTRVIRLTSVGWLREGRRRHSLGQYDWTKVKRDSSDVSTTAVDGNPDGDDSDRTYVGERRKDV
jgi:hypothetical protein